MDILAFIFGTSPELRCCSLQDSGHQEGQHLPTSMGLGTPLRQNRHYRHWPSLTYRSCARHRHGDRWLLPLAGFCHGSWGAELVGHQRSTVCTVQYMSWILVIIILRTKAKFSLKFPLKFSLKILKSLKPGRRHEPTQHSLMVSLACRQRGGGWQSSSGLVSEAFAAALSNLACQVAIDLGWNGTVRAQFTTIEHGLPKPKPGNKFGIYHESDLVEMSHKAVETWTSLRSKPCLDGEAGWSGLNWFLGCKAWEEKDLNQWNKGAIFANEHDCDKFGMMLNAHLGDRSWSVKIIGTPTWMLSS